jgi:DNA-binding NtrC family response regulator
VDVRVLCATHRDLQEETRRGRFRQDLYFRLAVFAIALPPLRERREDVPLLARHFADLFSARFAVERRLGQEALAALRAHAWPGNVRELQHVVEAAMVVCEGPVIGPEHLPASVRPPRAAAPAATLDEQEPAAAHAEGRTLTLEEMERAHIERVLRAHDGHRGLAARALGISERNLYRKLREWGHA